MIDPIGYLSQTYQPGRASNTHQRSRLFLTRPVQVQRSPQCIKSFTVEDAVEERLP
ncbi:MAG: hypothetical protein F6K16_42695 [Symploca sp. SIO2B6]|nr:hypothetical protein [Symploca sp. SIO2B6]